MQRRRAPAVDISSLPNVILSRILSFLPINEAVATSILSKRWINLWHYFDSINFLNTITLNNIESIISFNKFMESVLVVLVSRGDADAHFINSFRLKIEYGNGNIACELGFPNVTKWVDLLVQREIKYLCLHLDVCDDDDYSDHDVIGQKHILPISILSCKTLVSLDVAQFRVKDFTFSEFGFGFPSLKVLHLDYISFQMVGDFMLLLGGCPNLEELRATNIHFYYANSLTVEEFKSINLPKLISVVINQCWCLYFPLKAISNSEYLCIDTSLLCAKDHKFCEPQCSCYDIIFHNLIHLELHDTLELVPQKLQHFPNLQKLELHQGNQEGVTQNWVEPEVVPECFSSHLRICAIHNFGLQSELILVEYILKNARNLQILRMQSIRDHPDEIERKLSTCPKASATCQLVFY